MFSGRSWVFGNMTEAPRPLRCRMDMRHYSLVRTRFGQERRSRRKIPLRGPLPARHNEDLGLGPGTMDPVRELEAVAAHRHVNIRQKDVDRQARLQKHQGFGGIGCLDHLEIGIFEKV
jgi:hypothetical protein